ncbi:hypothetical protein FQN60_013293, partial [Etheostoma spectabile]
PKRGPWTEAACDVFPVFNRPDRRKGLVAAPLSMIVPARKEGQLFSKGPVPNTAVRPGAMTLRNPGPSRHTLPNPR